MGRVIWTPLALDDLQQLAEYLRETTPAKEQQIISGIVEKADQLAANPYSGQKSDYLSSAREELRTLLITRKIRLVYKVELNDDVTILQVFDLRSDRPFYR